MLGPWFDRVLIIAPPKHAETFFPEDDVFLVQLLGIILGV